MKARPASAKKLSDHAVTTGRAPDQLVEDALGLSLNEIRERYE